MSSFTRAALVSALLALANGQAVITKVVGDSGTGLGLQVSQTDKSDANFMSDAEIGANIVNECGRTLLAGNIDVGETSEIQLAAGQVTSVKKGSTVSVTMSQLNANGTGPYTCDLDLTNNSNGLTGQTPLTVTQGKATSATGDVTFKVAMPADMKCIGSSTGNMCTVRCRNAANFGGCFPVQQTDIAPSNNSPNTITTAQTLSGVLTQVQQNQKDLAAAVDGIATSSIDGQGKAVAEKILAAEPTVVAASNNPPAAAAKASKAGKAGANAATGKAGANAATGKAGANAATGKAGANAATGKAGANAATGNAATAKGGKGKANAANANAATANAATADAATADAATGNAATGKTGKGAKAAAAKAAKAAAAAAKKNKRSLRWAARTVDSSEEELN